MAKPHRCLLPHCGAKKRLGVVRGTSLSSVKVRKKSRMLMRKGKASKNGEDYNTDENEQNLNDLMLRMRKEAPQIYLTRRKVESLQMKTVQRDYNEIFVGNGMLKIVTKTMYQKKESRPKKVP